jgi:hypothetical protein
MDPDAYRHAVAAKGRAVRALERLSEASTLEDAEEAWDDYLHCASRVHEKLRAGAQGYSKSWEWFRFKLDERASDELLVYMHHARNNAHHRFEEVTRRLAGQSKFRPKPIAMGVIFLRTVGHKLALLPVIDKGIEYRVPQVHKGEAIRDALAITAGELMLVYLQESLDEAKSFLPESAV